MITLNDFDFGVLRRWARRLAVTMALLVALLSWHSGVTAAVLLIRTGVALLVLLGLTLGTVALLAKTAPFAAKNPPDGKGTLVDVAIGAEDLAAEPLDAEIDGLLPGEQAAAAAAAAAAGQMPGQVRRGLASGLPDAADQAEIVRRMGWGR